MIPFGSFNPSITASTPEGQVGNKGIFFTEISSGNVSCFKNWSTFGVRRAKFIKLEGSLPGGLLYVCPRGWGAGGRRGSGR